MAIVLHPGLNILYLADESSGYVYAITLPSDITRIPVGGVPTGIAVNPNTNMVYVANRLGYVSKIDTYSNSVLSNITVGNSPVGIAVNPNTDMLYISDQESNKIRVLNGTTDTLVGNITVGNSPVGIAVNPNTNLIYIAEKDPKSDLVHVVDGSTNKPLIGTTFKVNPSDSGDIYCNGKKVSDYDRFAVGMVECEAKANLGFVFSSWSGNINPSSKDNSLARFTVSESGTLTANFIQPTPISIPEELWAALYALIPAFFIPSIIKWLNRKRQRKAYRKIED